MADLERTYNVPLRRGYEKAPRYKRAKTALRVLKVFIAKHMKSENVKIGKYANLKLWENGIKNPPHHIKITAIKDKDGVVKVELAGRTYGVEKPKVERKDKSSVKKAEAKKPQAKKEEKPKAEKAE